MFARIFDSEKYGQILCQVEKSSSGDHQMKITIDPKREPFGLCSFEIGSDGLEDESQVEYRDRLREALSDLTMEIAEDFAKTIIETLPI